MFAQFLHNNLVKFCCARLNIFKLCILKTLILKGLNRYDLSTPPVENSKENQDLSTKAVDKKEKNVEKSSEIVENEEPKDNISTSTVDNKEEKRYKNNKMLVSCSFYTLFNLKVLPLFSIKNMSSLLLLLTAKYNFSSS